LNQLKITSDGSHTIYVPELDEHYHSVHGAVQESNHIFIDCGFKFCKADPVKIFEVGFGTGLNALLTALECADNNRVVDYTSVEKYPLTQEFAQLLNYKEFTGIKGGPLFTLIHSAEWEESQKISPYFSIKKIRADLITDHFEGIYDLVYFDAFGPDKQPEMWGRDIFGKISSLMAQNGILVTYSAKGEVKRNLKANGFDVSFLPGPPGKREIIRAIKI
jgi:tRNA U34 5-methylaminomethyl-2-thiouridine-forming methyltransferase MnmC